MKKILSNILTSREESKDSSLFSFKNLSEKFFWSLKWNTLESVVYHLIFIIHQSYMFSLIEPKLYGIMGTFFASSYLSVTIIMGALDVALMPWIVTCTKSKGAFIEFIRKHILPQVGIYLLTPLFLFLIFKAFWIPENLFILEKHFFIMGIFIAGEGIKKLFRHILQLMFLNKSTAILEIGGIALYSGIVWIRYFFGYVFTVEGLIIPFIISSTLSIGGIIYSMFTFYKTLPEEKSRTKVPSWKQVGYLRLIASINQITRSLFSANIIIPVTAACFGFLESARIVFVNYVSHTFTFFIYKICAPSAGAFFGRMTLHKKTEQHEAFILVMKTIGLFIGITTIIMIGVALYGSLHFTFSVLTILIGFLIIHTIENIFIMYEKFLIIRNQSEFLALLNALNLLCSYLLLRSSLTLPVAAFFCFALRLLVFTITSCGILMLKK